MRQMITLVRVHNATLIDETQQGKVCGGAVSRATKERNREEDRKKRKEQDFHPFCIYDNRRKLNWLLVEPFGKAF